MCCQRMEAADMAESDQYIAKYNIGAEDCLFHRATWKQAAAIQARGAMRAETNRTVSVRRRSAAAAPQHQIPNRARLATPRTF